MKLAEGIKTEGIGYIELLNLVTSTEGIGYVAMSTGGIDYIATIVDCMARSSAIMVQLLCSSSCRMQLQCIFEAYIADGKAFKPAPRSPRFDRSCYKFSLCLV